MILKRLEYEFLVYSNYEPPKYWNIEYYVITSGKIGTVSGHRQVTALSDAIICNVHNIYLVIPNALMKRKQSIKHSNRIPPAMKCCTQQKVPHRTGIQTKKVSWSINVS